MAQKPTRHPPDPTARENLEQRMLFEEYVKLGPRRSLRKLWEKDEEGKAITDRGPKTVQLWSAKFSWPKKAVELDKDIAAGCGFETPKSNVERKRLILDLLDVMIRECAVVDDKGKVTGSLLHAKNVFDLRTLIDIRDEQLGVKKSPTAQKAGDTNIDKAIFIIKK